MIKYERRVFWTTLWRTAAEVRVLISPHARSSWEGAG
jgi:hypothetical protein